MKKITIIVFALATLAVSAQNKSIKKVKQNSSSKISALTSAPSNYYSFSTFTASYQSITGTSVTSAGTKWDEPTDIIPVGFNFKLYDEQNDTIQLQGGSYLFI